MSESKCYLCEKPGKFEKLFRNCKHESACHTCLRVRYVIQAPQFSISSYSCNPFLCFHPECNLELRNTQMKRLVRSKKELQNYCNIRIQAKIQQLEAEKHEELQQARFHGPGWQCTLQALGEEFLSQICRCPRCKMMISKNGGCDHMTCICGAEFDWRETRRSISKSCREIIEKYDVKYQKLHQRCANMTPVAAIQTKKKARRPKLPPVDDDFMDDDFMEDSEDEFSPSEDDCTESVNPVTSVSDVDSFPSDFDSSSFPSIPLVEAAAVESSQTEDWVQDFHILELASDASDDSWTQFDADAGESSIATDDDFQISRSQTSWEEVSEVSSVVSFHSKTGMSFLEAARASPSNQPNRRNRWKDVPKLPQPKTRLQTITEHRKPVLSEHESDNDENIAKMFDADFIYEGAKCSRGGKKKLMFKRQLRQRNR